ncbi:unnamed protein product [Absidia cylindrospora]
MADFNQIAKAFVEFYYQTFDTNRPGLQTLYREGSMLTFEGQQFRGANDVTEKLVSLPFQKVVHHISTIDAQPSTADGSILVIVSGQLLVSMAWCMKTQTTHHLL